MADMRMVQVTNRTSKRIEVIIDGVPRVFQPGKHGENWCPAWVAEMARRRSIKLGTEDPYNPQIVEHLLAVESWGQDCSPTEQDEEARERINRSLLPDDRQEVLRVVPPGLQAIADAHEGKATGQLRNFATPAGPNDPRVLTAFTAPDAISDQ